MPVHHTKLVKERTYYIKVPEVYTGKFIGYTEEGNLLFRVSMTSDLNGVIIRFCACNDYYYYDAEEMKARVNAEKARQQIEERSLQMILKKVVNDDFKW